MWKILVCSLAVLGACAVGDAITDFFQASEEAAERTADLAETVDYVVSNAWMLLAGYLGGRGGEAGAKKLWKRVNGKAKATKTSRVDAKP